MATATYATEKTREVSFFWSKSPPSGQTGYTWWKYKKKVRTTAKVMVGIESEAGADEIIDSLSLNPAIRDISSKLGDGGLWTVTWTEVQTYTSYVANSGTNSLEDGEDFEE